MKIERCTDTTENRCTIKCGINIDLEGTIPDVVSRLLAAKDLAIQTCKNLGVAPPDNMRVERVWDGYEDCHDEVLFERQETVKEWKIRVHHNAKRLQDVKNTAENKKRARIKQLKSELAQLERG